MSKIDSQHFWDMMDVLPPDCIADIETDLIAEVSRHYDIKGHNLLYDTTNFYTFIHTTNTRNTIAQRGKNKQHRADLRQVGMAMAVTQRDHLPLFHLTYQGNWHDTTVFDQILDQVQKRLQKLGFDQSQHTLVFDRGNNTRQNFQKLRNAGFYYVGALTPSHHKQLVEEAFDRFETIEIEDKPIPVYRSQYEVWGKLETVVVLISEQLKAGQIRGIYRSIDNKEKELRKLQEKLRAPEAKNVTNTLCKNKSKT